MQPPRNASKHLHDKKYHIKRGDIFNKKHENHEIFPTGDFEDEQKTVLDVKVSFFLPKPKNLPLQFGKKTN